MLETKMDSTGKIVTAFVLGGLGWWGVSSLTGDGESYKPEVHEPASSFSSFESFSETRSPSTGDRDCGDFSTHAQAQAFFEDEGPGDPHGLDRDNDGNACETLP